jgi:glutamate N-acetyltransferase / amino-acid N-acetyltransferase
VLRDDWIAAPDGLELLPGGSATSPEGFEAGAAACGLKPSGGLDVGLLRSVRPTASALVDTVNALPSAPVLHTRSLDRSGLRAVVVNAGNANAATGSPGLEDARAMGARAAQALGLAADEVAVSSTGTVGERLDLERVLRGIDAAAGAADPEGGPEFARAICTTDRAPKSGAFRLALPGGGAVRIGAAAKGAGMISPRMATMLAYVTSDAAVDRADLGPLTAAAAEASFNRISVDGQMSPSDTLLVLANGGGRPLAGADLATFAGGLAAVCRWLAVQMVRDGEGAEHAMRIVVRGAADPGEAAAVARAVGDSPLVKTAAFGRDPNWGRISQAVGQALAGRGGPPAELRVAFDGVLGGDPGVAEVLAREEYDLEISLGRGTRGAVLWASDLGHAYVTLNAEYHT